MLSVAVFILKAFFKALLVAVLSFKALLVAVLPTRRQRFLSFSIFETFVNCHDFYESVIVSYFCFIHGEV